MRRILILTIFFISFLLFSSIYSCTKTEKVPFSYTILASYKSSICYSKSSKLKLLERSDAIDYIQDSCAIRAEELYQLGLKYEKEKYIEQALKTYTFSNIKFMKCIGLKYFPSELAIFNINLNGKYNEMVATPISSSDIYRTIGKCILLENSLKEIKSQVKFSHEKSNRNLYKMLSIIEGHINMLKKVLMYDKMIVNKTSYMIVGYNQVDFLVEGLLSDGLIFNNNMWEIIRCEGFDKNTELYPEKNNILSDIALIYDKERSFLPGLLFIKKYWGINDDSSVPKSLKSIASENIWEFCLFNDYWEKEKDKAFEEFMQGLIFEASFNNYFAMKEYYKARNSFPGYVEPLLHLKKINYLDRADEKLVNQVQTYLDNIVFLQREINFQKDNNGKNFNLVNVCNASLNHIFLIQNLLLGRLHAAEPVIEKKSTDDIIWVNSILGVMFYNQWFEGMNNYGIKLNKENWKIDKIDFKKYNELIINNDMVTNGYWKGTFLDEEMNIIVLGKLSIKELSHKTN